MRGVGRILALALALSLSVCGGAADHRGDPSLDAELRLSPTPPMTGSAGVRVRATDQGSVVTPPGEVAVGVRGVAGSPTPLDFEDGAWVGGIDFPEPGEVRVEVTVTTPDGRSATLGIPVRVVRRP